MNDLEANESFKEEVVKGLEKVDLQSMEIDSEDKVFKKVNPLAVADYTTYIKLSFTTLVLGSNLNILLVFTIPALFGDKLTSDRSRSYFNEGTTFVMALLALIPLAERLGYVTEQLAIHTNPTLGGLLNATFGNLTEVIVCVVALQKNMFRIVQLSMLGSVLSNLLLVLGCALWVGGYKHKVQTYNKRAALINCALLTLALMGLVLPASLANSPSGHVPQAPGEKGVTEEVAQAKMLLLSRWCSLGMLLMYGFYLVFQLHTHKELFEEEDDDDDEDEDDVLGFWGAIFWLSVITLFISLLSDVLVDTIKGAASSYGWPTAFIGTILIPIVGNAAEHASAVIFAYRNKMDLALAVAVGSAVQIALFVIPFAVVVAWWESKALTLYFHPMETASMFVAVISVVFVIQIGESNWLMGAMLVFAYFFVAMAFWVHRDEKELHSGDFTLPG